MIHQPTRWLRAALDAWLELGGNLALALLDAPAQVRYPPGEGSGSDESGATVRVRARASARARARLRVSATHRLSSAFEAHLKKYARLPICFLANSILKTFVCGGSGGFCWD